MAIPAVSATGLEVFISSSVSFRRRVLVRTYRNLSNAAGFEEAGSGTINAPASANGCPERMVGNPEIPSQ
jgi:hypothetical protein